MTRPTLRVHPSLRPLALRATTALQVAPPRGAPENPPMRLHKYIANCGYCSRRRAELLIQAGRVKVNGKVVERLGTSVFPGDSVTINDEPIALPEPLAIIFNKPAGIITSTHDTHERLTVMDYLPRSLRDHGVLPVGRLDQDTEGLLILTNDGDLNHRITHPRHETEKEYAALVSGRPAPAALRRLEQGVEIDGERTSPARIERVEPKGERTLVHIVIGEGKKRQVRRMFAAIGHEVLELRRIRIGGLTLGDLPLGAWRKLGDEEIAALTQGGR
jgi:23S rRNA pseudouridine2605 synthase